MSSFWERTRTTGKKGFDWAWQKAGVAGEYLNKGAGKMGMEGFWPVDMPRELDKAARILYTFTLRGDKPQSGTEDKYADKKTQKVVARIPAKIIEKAEGIAIFTVWRTGFGISASSGSGIVIARDSPTSWGAPSGILIHTIGFGFLAGMDVYDAVLILRTRKAVEAFARPKVSLGAEIAVVAGPVGAGAMLDSGIEASPVFSYVKSKGVYGGLQVDGTVIIERNDENKRFYGRPYKAEKLLSGSVPIPGAARGFLAVLEAAEGKQVDPSDFPEDVDVAPSEQVAQEQEQQQSSQGKGHDDPQLSSSGAGAGGIDTRRSLGDPITLNVNSQDDLILRPSSMNDVQMMAHQPADSSLMLQNRSHSVDTSRDPDLDNDLHQGPSSPLTPATRSLTNSTPPSLPPRRRPISTPKTDQ